MPKISVIVPVYNTEKYLHRCVDSILAQTFTDFELLLIDDGSTDSSGAICDEYAQKDSRVRVFHKENGGASSARNLGLDNATGEWITFCDSDDFVYSYWLSNFDVDKNGRTYDIICQGIECSKKFVETHNSNKYLFDFSRIRLNSCILCAFLVAIKNFITIHPHYRKDRRQTPYCQRVVGRQCLHPHR